MQGIRAANKRRREKIFEERDMVIIYLRKQRIPTGSYSKLKPKKYGLFKIVRRYSMLHISTVITQLNNYILMITQKRVLWKMKGLMQEINATAAGSW